MAVLLSHADRRNLCHAKVCSYFCLVPDHVQSKARSPKCRKGRQRRSAVCDGSSTREWLCQQTCSKVFKLSATAWLVFFEQRSSSRINKIYNLQMQSVLEETRLRDLEMRKNTLFARGPVESLHWEETQKKDRLNKKLWTACGTVEHVLSVFSPENTSNH